MSKGSQASEEFFGIMYADLDGVEGLLMLPKEEVAFLRAIHGDHVVPVRHFPTRELARKEIKRFFKKAPPQVRNSARVVDRREIEAFAARTGIGMAIHRPN